MYNKRVIHVHYTYKWLLLHGIDNRDIVASRYHNIVVV